MTGQQFLFSEDRGSPPQPVGPRRTEDFAEDRTYQLPIRVIRIPAWHPRIRPPHLRPDPDFERLVRSVQRRDLCDPLVVRMEGGTVQLVSGVRRYWAMEEVERREGRPVTAPVRFQHVDPRRAMAMAAALNTGVKWSALEESLFAVRMRAEVEQEEGREVTVDELAGELPWCVGKTSERLTIGQAFPLAFLEANGFSVHDVNALSKASLLRAAARRSPDTRVQALRNAIHGRQQSPAPAGRRARSKYTLRGSDRGGVEILRCPDPHALSAAEAGEVLDILEPLVESLRRRLGDAREGRASEAA
jgi:hypothetical protein